jgi:glycolate oxidase FAD binding subunit
MLPLDVVHPRSATLGGTLACDMAGLRASCYGGPRDLATGLRVLDAAGGELDAENAEQHQIGALGTLGVIVEARFKLAPVPETETTLLGIFGDATAALEAVPALASQTPRPCALAVVRAGGLAPLTHLAPLHGERALLAVRLSGTHTEVARAGQAGRAILRRTGARTILSVEPELQEAFWGPVLDFTQTAMARTGEALLRVEALPAETADVMRHAAELASAHGLSVAELADALSGRVWLRLRPRPPSTSVRPREQQDLARGLAAVFAALRQRWPRTVVLDCPSALAGELAVWGAPAPAVTLAALRAARQRLDPAGLLNPGRYPLESAGTD